MAALRGNLIVGSFVLVLRQAGHDAVRWHRRKTCVDVQDACHRDGERADQLDQALAAQDFHETQLHYQTNANFAVHAVSDGRYTIMLTHFATI